MRQQKLFIIPILIFILGTIKCINSERDPYENQLKIYIVDIEDQVDMQLKVQVKITNLTNRQMKRIGLACFVSGGGKEWVKKSDILNEIGKRSLEPNESADYTFVFDELTTKITGVFVLTGFIHYFETQKPQNTSRSFNDIGVMDFLLIIIILIIGAIVVLFLAILLGLMLYAGIYYVIYFLLYQWQGKGELDSDEILGDPYQKKHIIGGTISILFVAIGLIIGEGVYKFSFVEGLVTFGFFLILLLIAGNYIINKLKERQGKSSLKVLKKSKFNIPSKGINLLLPYNLDHTFKIMFEQLGYKVYWSHNLLDIEIFIKNATIDVGLEWQWDEHDHTILNLVKEHKKNIPVILCLNWNGKIPDNFTELGYKDYLTIPFKTEEVRKKIHQVVKK